MIAGKAPPAAELRIFAVRCLKGMDAMPATRPPGSRSPDPVPLELAEERALLAALARGDRSAAERLAESTYRQIWAVLVRLTGGDLDLAADLTQETYRKAWEAILGAAKKHKCDAIVMASVP